MFKFRLLFSLLLASCAVWTSPSDVYAKGAAADDVKAEIMAKLHKVEAALVRGDTAEQVARSMYANNVLMVGEGEAASRRGIDVAITGVQGWMDSLGPNGGKGCKYSIPDPVVASDSTFTSFVLLVCKANPPVLTEDQQLRMVYSWEKGSDGWRVVLEMWALGVM